MVFTKVVFTKASLLSNLSPARVSPNARLSQPSSGVISAV